MVKNAVALLVGLLVSVLANAETIFLGFDTQTPVQQFSTGGSFLGNFGQNGATGSALDGAGHVWTVAPAFGNNVIVKYDASQNILNSFVATVNGQWIEDMAYGGQVGGIDTLWVGTFDGDIHRINANTGAIISTFNPNRGTFLGVAFDGTNLYVTGSFGSTIGVFNTSGVLQSTITTNVSGLGGIGYSSLTQTLWAGTDLPGGGFGGVTNLSLTGATISSFAAGTAFHDGLEIGDIGGGTTPEPATLLLVGGGLAALWLRRRAGVRTGSRSG